MRFRKESNLYSLIPTIFIAVYIAFELRASDPKFFPDSGGYLPKGEIYSVGDWTGEAWGITSFSGFSVRPWPITSIYELFSSSSQRIIFQSFFYIMSVYFLIRVINSILHKKNFSNGVVFTNLFLVVYFTHPQVMQWNFIILSESISISLLILYFASLIMIVYSDDNLHHKFFYILLFFNIFILFFLSIVKFAMVFLFLSNLVFLILSSKNIQNNLFKLVYSALLLILPTISYVTNSNIDSTWGMGDKPGRVATNYFFLSADGPNTPLSATLRAEITKEAPECLLDVIALDSSPYGILAEASSKCPEGVAWLNTNFSLWYVKFLLNNPSYTSAYIMHYSKYAMTHAQYFNLQTSIFPQALGSFFFTQENSINERNSSFFYFIVLVFLFLTILILNFYFKLHRNIFVLFAVCFASFMSYFLNLLLITAEISRTTILSNIAIHISSVLTLLFLSVKWIRKTPI